MASIAVDASRARPLPQEGIRAPNLFLTAIEVITKS
ncbi:hypothetical protein YSA_07352 [Pseudomonas putida ND6]|uniref:Uncharacterized protein n=1 Tax=Pseudomonas putida ND6 TaxID=231023 RepID=I3UZ25_PSEPU|nr:hypothetical protein YSA_07352 [Pseudomonas putida ND6]